MLKIFFEGEDGCPKITINDIEAYFSTVELTGTIEEKLAINKIDLGTYKNSTQFEDRFNVTLYTDELSTGCKACLLVLNKPNDVISLKECGDNAVTAIVHLCHDGTIVLRKDQMYSFGWFHKDYANIDVLINGYSFKSIDRLKDYMDNEYPLEPIDGVEKYVEKQC